LDIVPRQDGVLNRKIEDGYVLDPSMLEILPGVPQAVAALARCFGSIVVVTNQRGIGRGLLSADDLGRIHARLLAEIGRNGGRIDAIFVCPHDLKDGCECRKPKVGLALRARAQIPSIVFERSVLVGDSDTDIRMEKALGMVTVRIAPGAGASADGMAFPGLLEFAKFLG
jgi:D-glycero-D-manno-heptose 1,7-bisphosphate phosphatase